MSINSVSITGNLGKDPELSRTASGTDILNFSVAVNERRKGFSGEWEDYTNWIPVAVFGKRAESLSNLISKGMKVAVQGKLRYQTWEKDGYKHSKISVIADEVDIMQKAEKPSQPVYDDYSYDADLPF